MNYILKKDWITPDSIFYEKGTKALLVDMNNDLWSMTNGDGEETIIIKGFITNPDWFEPEQESNTDIRIENQNDMHLLRAATAIVCNYLKDGGSLDKLKEFCEEETKPIRIFDSIDRVELWDDEIRIYEANTEDLEDIPFEKLTLPVFEHIIRNCVSGTEWVKWPELEGMWPGHIESAPNYYQHFNSWLREQEQELMEGTQAELSKQDQDNSKKLTAEEISDLKDIVNTMFKLLERRLILKKCQSQQNKK